MEKPQIKEVFTIIENGEDKTRWIKIGVAFINKDNSINVVLNALPINGKLNIRDPKPAQEA